MIKVGFSTHAGNPLSAIIRWFTKSKVSHCWVYIEDPFFGVPVVLEASEFGLRLTTFEEFQKKATVVELIDPQFPLDVGVHDAWPWLGAPYDYTGLFGMSWVILGRRLKRSWVNPLAHKNAMFCSEAIVKILQAMNFPGADKLIAQDTGPQDLLAFLTMAMKVARAGAQAA